MLHQHVILGIQFFIYHIHGTPLFLMTRPLLEENLTIIQDGRYICWISSNSYAYLRSFNVLTYFMYVILLHRFLFIYFLFKKNYLS